jgi:L-asparaginase/Glu-tRNA(Gln) amidotransferase subunit D
MERIVDKTVECMHDSGYNEAFADLNFDKKVKIIYTDPFKTIADYTREIAGASGVVIAGYGGGNINIETASGYSPLPLIKELISANIPVVLASQVALGVSDFIYENARFAIESGAISGVDLSLPEIQIRLAYLLGHKTQIEASAKRLNIPFMALLDRLFISGMKFRTRKSKEMYRTLKGFGPSQNDILINSTFEESLLFAESLL